MKSKKLRINNTTVWEFTQADGILGYLGIDSEIGGKSCGGLRYLPDLDAGEIAGLARAMTYKYGFLGVPQGGAKAGIRSWPGENKTGRNRRLQEFGEAVSPWLRQKKYFPGTDMGVDIEDLNIILKAAGISLKPWQLGCRESGTYTAATVLSGIRAACHRKGRQVENCAFSIEGFGAVGSSLARMLHEAGGRVIALSTINETIFDNKGLDIPKILARKDTGEEKLFSGFSASQSPTHEELKELPVDIFSPCARHDSITVDNAAKIQAWAVVPGANNPITAEAEKILISRNIVSVPDFVTNSGGVLGGTMAFAGTRHGRILDFIETQFDPVYEHLFSASETSGLTMRQVAEKLALERHGKIRMTTANPSLAGRIFGLGLRIYRTGLIPKFLMSLASRRYFSNLPVFRDIAR